MSRVACEPDHARVLPGMETRAGRSHARDGVRLHVGMGEERSIIRLCATPRTPQMPLHFGFFWRMFPSFVDFTLPQSRMKIPYFW